MACHVCENYVDLGMQQSDIRHRFELREYNTSEDDEDHDEYDYDVTAKIVIGVSWGFGPCKSCGESGQIPEPRWYVEGPGRVWRDLPGENTCFAVIEDVWPEAVAEERDPDWESERHLRMAEGWGCPGDWPRYG